MEEVIAAIATGASRGAIGIVRLSGEGAAACVEKVFTPLRGAAFGAGKPGQLRLGTLRDAEGKVLDQALATFSRAPNSYTGEDTAEVHCHGSPTVLNLALEALFSAGARQAKPGEFTRRAFLNGKLDLVQAEAVADLIDAQTPAAARAAASQLEGALSQRLEKIYSDLIDLLAHFQAAVDYPDEDIEPLEQQEIRQALQKAQEALEALLRSYERGKFLNQGLPCAIVGAPNAGKSSLLNALVGYDRAIVTDIPGTTRDTVEERCSLGGVLLRLTDTAGLRDAQDQVEQIGVERSRKAMETAGLILAVADGTQGMNRELEELIQDSVALAPTILVWNKADLAGFCPAGTEVESVSISAKDGQGLETLEKAVAEKLGQRETEEVLLTNPRQAQQARQALEALENAAFALEAGFDFDAPLMDVEHALSAMGGLTGREVQNDVVDRVFARFCVGK